MGTVAGFVGEEQRDWLTAAQVSGAGQMYSERSRDCLASFQIPRHYTSGGDFFALSLRAQQSPLTGALPALGEILLLHRFSAACTPTQARQKRPVRKRGYLSDHFQMFFGSFSDRSDNSRIQNGSENDPKMIRKSSENHPKMIPSIRK